MALAVLSHDRAWGKVSELAQSYGVSRKTIYDIAAKGQQVLLAGLQPGPHGPTLSEKLIRVNRNRLVRGKRADQCPARLVGLEVPDDPLFLLGLQPKVLI